MRGVGESKGVVYHEGGQEEDGDGADQDGVNIERWQVIGEVDDKQKN